MFHDDALDPRKPDAFAHIIARCQLLERVKQAVRIPHVKTRAVVPHVIHALAVHSRVATHFQRGHRLRCSLATSSSEIMATSWKA